MKTFYIYLVVYARNYHYWSTPYKWNLIISRTPPSTWYSKKYCWSIKTHHWRTALKRLKGPVLDYLGRMNTAWGLNRVKLEKKFINEIIRME